MKTPRWANVLFSTIVSGALLTACGGLTAHLKRRFNQVHPGCPSREVKVSAVEMPGSSMQQMHYNALGCDATERFVRICIPNVGCQFHAVSDAINRAEFESGCPADQFQTSFLDPTTVGLTGCDQKLVYKVQYEGWMLNSSREPRQQGEAS